MKLKINTDTCCGCACLKSQKWKGQAGSRITKSMTVWDLCLSNK